MSTNPRQATHVSAAHITDPFSSGPPPVDRIQPHTNHEDEIRSEIELVERVFNDLGDLDRNDEFDKRIHNYSKNR